MTSFRPSYRAAPRDGFNLIEAAIVLGIVGLVVGGIWAAASAAYENMRQQSASKQLLALVGNIRGFYANSGTETVDTNLSNLNNLRLLPADMTTVTGGVTTMRHPWGGGVTVTSAPLAQFSSFGVVFSQMPSGPCKNFLVRNANAARGSGLLTINSGTEVLNLVSNSAATLPSNVACGNNATVTLAFNLR